MRRLALILAHIVVAAAALAIMYLMPVVAIGPNGRSYDPVGIGIDVAALVVLVLVGLSATRTRDVGHRPRARST